MVAWVAVANVYAEPRGDAEVTSQVLHGWGVDVLERTPGWLRVRMHDGYTGWVQSESFVEDHARADELVLRVEGVSANVYAEPDVKRRAALVQVPWEGRLWGVRQEGAWWEVRLPGGRAGFVHAGDVSQDHRLLSLQEMLETGRRFLGVTYTWGGVSSVGYDCSGLVQMMMRQRGLSLPRDAQAQRDWSGFRPVALEEVQAGDVVFFGPTSDEITHVGMCQSEGEFLHSTTEGRPGVQVSRFAEAPWPERIQCARRLRDEVTGHRSAGGGGFER